MSDAKEHVLNVIQSRASLTSPVKALAHLCREPDTAASADGDSTREDLKRDILLAHMLSLLTQQYMPAHALPALATYLTDKGVMPQWVQVCS